MLPSWYILSLKPKGKSDCKNLIHLSSISCLLIFFNLVDEYGSYIIFSTGKSSLKNAPKAHENFNLMIEYSFFILGPPVSRIRLALQTKGQGNSGDIITFRRSKQWEMCPCTIKTFYVLCIFVHCTN